MKKPFLDQFQRICIIMDSAPGHRYQFALAWAKLKREIERAYIIPIVRVIDRWCSCGAGGTQ
jgi:hypothetical protein